MIIAAPASAAQVYVPPLAGVQHLLAPQVMDAMRQRGATPVSLWRVINDLTNAHQPDSRTQRRFVRLRFLGAIRELLRVGLLHRHGPLIAKADFRWTPRSGARVRAASRRLQGVLGPSPTVGAGTSGMGGSNRSAARVDNLAKDHQTFEREPHSSPPGTPTRTTEAKSAAPTMAEVSAAARSLARQPRKLKRPWSGWLHGVRLRRLRPVIVPGGQVLPAYAVRRGWVYALLPDTPEFAGRTFERYRAAEVRIYRSPHAALLGSRKRGRTERPSALKARMARINGTLPCHTGKRRGRPRGRE